MPDLAGFASAEDINHGAATHPSARLATAITGYEDLKASNAFFALAEAGLGVARARCPRFDAWLTRWETWGAPRFKGTRVPVDSLFTNLESGLSLDEYIDCFPDVTRERAVALLECAQKVTLRSAA
ncbi:MAG: DUF4276 family protein [Limisphaerales bacterium]